MVVMLRQNHKEQRVGDVLKGRTDLKKDGFTIVELLIVIVVIAILAAITVVAYNGIQGSASDSAVQSDINAFVKKIKMYEVENSMPPPGGSYDGGNNSTGPGGLSIKVTQVAYREDAYQWYYCRADVAPYNYGVAAVSKSGKVFAYTSQDGWYNYTGSWGSSGMSGTICPVLTGVSTANSSFSYGKGTGNWFGWTTTN
ncbi:hypothetical protein CMN23_00185 [Candidatus Saccharibacteria bacterium]|nr:hypothetical protein [Candidatus Saccharibacteria bacterium]MBJ58232.1 hypothetical protein [Candidatus Saccharibacteria bacterium]|tara:strand:+ start:1659 stop:2252 length:594 start_codon:yes stop_codon:yes gene_type:complete